MHYKLTVLGLFSMLVSVVSGSLKWDTTEEQIKMLKTVKDKNGAMPFCDAKFFGLEQVKDNIALVIIQLPQTEFQTYQLNLATKSIEALRFGSSTLEKLKKTAEMYVKITFNCSWEKTDFLWHRSQLTGRGLPRLEDLWEIEASDDKAMVVKKCVALVTFDDGSFGFAPYIYSKVCNSDGKMSSDTNNFIVLGYSQKCESKSIAKQGLLAYLCNDASFGKITLLPALYSGAENLARVAAAAKAQEIKDLIRPHATADEVKVLRAWSIANHTRCIAICSIASSETIQYFFVIYKSSEVEKKILLNRLLHMGNRGPTEFGTMMGLVDYLKPNYLSGVFATNEMKMGTGVAEVINAADFSARKLLENCIHGEPDNIPRLNHAIEITNLVIEKIKYPSSIVCAALLLLPTLKESTTLDEIANLFGPKVKSVMNVIIPDLTLELATAVIGNQTIFKLLETPTISTTSLVQGNTIETPESVLVKVLKERRKKAQIRENIQENPPVFQISLVQSRQFGNVQYGIYELIEFNLGQIKKYYFRVIVTDPFNTTGTIVVGELHCTLAPFDAPYLEEFIKQANAYKKILDEQYYRDSYENVVKLMKCLDYAAKKHYHVSQRRKDYQRTPYINHAIGVARILVQEGGIDDLELVMAAILHDVLHHTSATEEEVKAMFGKQIAEIVVEVSGSSDGSVIDTQLQNEIDWTQRPVAVLVRLADRIYNLRDFDRQCPPEYPEAKRRWQFTSAANLVCRLQFNYKNNTKWIFENTKYKFVFERLLGVLESIVDSHRTSLLSPLEFANQVNGIGG